MIYLITGVLGSGKTLVTIGKIRDALWAGKRVATNLNLKLEYLVEGRRKYDVRRLSDFPTSEELWALGSGNNSFDEKKNGLIVIDEAGAFLNARSWQDDKEERAKIVTFLLHTRKLGWDVLLIVQDVTMLDKQIRVGLVEHLVKCRRLDRLRVLAIWPLLRLIGLSGRMPQIHIAVVLYGTGTSQVVVDRWWYWGNELYPAYDTRQVFGATSSGPYSMLDPARAPWLKARYTLRWKLYDLLSARVPKLAWVWDFFAPDTSAPWYQFLITERYGCPSYQTDSAPSYHDWLRERMLCEPEGQGGQPALAHPFEPQMLAAAE